MKKLFWLLAFCLCAAPGWAQPDEPNVIKLAPAAQIEESVREFVTDANKGWLIQAQDYVVAARRGYFGAQLWLPRFVAAPSFPLQVTKIETLTLDKERATIAVSYDLGAPKDAQTAPKVGALARREVLELKRAPGISFNPTTRVQSRIWQIVPPPTRPAEPKRDDKGALWLTYLSWKIAQRPLAKTDYDPQQSLKNLEQLAQAAQLLSQDYDSIAAAPEFLRELLMPYLKDETPFYVPNSYEPYAFNANLSGRPIDNGVGVLFNAEGVRADTLPGFVANPDRVILFYEGRDQKLDFRYDGQAAVAFADGHSALVSPEGAKTLIWQP